MGIQVRPFSFLKSPHRNLLAKVLQGVLLTLSFFFYALLPVMAGETKVLEPRRTTRLVVADFEKRAGDSRFDILGRSIPGLLHIALLPYVSIRPVGSEVLWLKLAEMQVPREEMNPQRILQRDILRAVDADYLLRGSFLELGGTIQITGALLNIQTNKSRKIGPIRMEVTDISAGITSFAKHVVQAIAEAEMIGYKVRRFAVSCFQDKSRFPSSKSKWVKRDLAISLATYLAAHSGIKVMEWKMVEKYCDAPLDGFLLAKALKVDAVIGGFIKVERDRLYIYPEIFIAENDLRADMPNLESDVEEYLEQKIILADKIMEFLDAIITQEGIWKVAELVEGEGNAEDYLRRGKEFSERGEMGLAVLCLQKALTMQPIYPEAHYSLGFVRLSQKRFGDAAEEFRKAIAAKSDFAEAQVGLGYAYFRLKEYSESIEAYNAVLRLNPELDSFLYRDIGTSYLYQGMLDRAEDSFRSAISKEPLDAESHFWLGVTASLRRNDKEAIAWYKKALKIDPEFENASNQLAQVFRRKGQAALMEKEYQQAIDHFNQGIHYNPTADAYYFRALAYSYILNYISSIRDYLTAIQLGEEAPDRFANRRGALLNLAEVYILSKRYNDANTWAHRSVRALGGKSPNEYELMARLLLIVTQIFQGQDYGEELKRLRRDLASGKYRPVAWDFSLLDNFVRGNDDIGQEKQDLILRLTREVKRKPRK